MKNLWLLFAAMLLIVSLPSAHAVLNASRVNLYLPFNNTGNDFSGTGYFTPSSGQNNGTYIANCFLGATCYSPVNVSIYHYTAVNFAGNYTVSFWANITNNAAVQMLYEFAPNSLTEAIYSQSGAIKSVVDTGQIYPPDQSNKWNFYSIVCDDISNNLKLYVNGTSVFNGTAGVDCSDQVNADLGLFNSQNIYQYFGEMACLSIFNQSLSMADEQSLFTQGGNPYTNTGSGTCQVAPPVPSFATYRFSNNVYETNPASVFANYTALDPTITSLNASFFYNGNSIPITTNIVFSVPGPDCAPYCFTQYIFNSSWTPGLEPANNTVESWYWEYTIGYSNGTMTTFNDGPQTQNVLWAYFLPANPLVTDFASYISTQISTATLSVAAFAQGAHLDSNLSLLYANRTVLGQVTNPYFASIGNNLFSASAAFNVGNANNSNDNRTWTGTFNFTFRNPQGLFSTRFFNTSSLVNVTRVALTNCSDPNYPLGQQYPVLNMTILDEQTDGPIFNGTIQITNSFYANSPANAQNISFNFTLGNSANASMCIYPNSAVVIDTAYLAYVAPNYSPRTYAFTGPLSNATQKLNLFLLTANFSNLVNLAVVDNNNIPVGGVQVQIQEWFPGTGAYLTVAGFVSDNLGRGQTYLNVPNIQYRFILSQNGVVVNTIGPQNIYCPSGQLCPPQPYVVVLQLNPAVPPLFYSSNGQLAVSCSFNQATSNLLCTAVDLTGFTDTFQLIVLQRNAISLSTVCTTQATSSAATLICNLGNFTGNFYQYSVYLVKPSGNLIIGSSTLDFSNPSGFGWGIDGLFFSFLIIGTLFFMFLQLGPEMAIIMGGGLGTIISFFLGILPIDLAGAVGLICVVGLTLFAMGR